MKFVNDCDGLSIEEMRMLVYRFAMKLELDVPNNWKVQKMAGKSWYYSFIERHKSQSLRKPENTSLSRVEVLNSVKKRYIYFIFQISQNHSN